MNREDIINMAQKAGFEKFSSNLDDWLCFAEELECFFHMAYNAGAAAEREACAKVCEGRLQHGLNFEGCAAAIRARGNT